MGGVGDVVLLLLSVVVMEVVVWMEVDRIVTMMLLY